MLNYWVPNDVPTLINYVGDYMEIKNASDVDALNRMFIRRSTLTLTLYNEYNICIYI